ncbi:MAG: 30S ribosomal protein S2 [Candidatus Theseobacter exili]|nr:30S ribosomal protein S2 [Candidatus Theseobacter exili]
MAVITIKELLEAGAHLGHRTNRWNPKMKRYIFEERNGIYIIDLKQTLRQVEIAWQFVRDCVAEGNEIIFVGTKKQSRKIVAEIAKDSEMPWISERWLGGTLTNFTTIRKSVKRLNELDKMEKDGILKKLSKKEASALRRQATKLHRNLDGVKDMERLPGAMIVVDVDKEKIAVLEALKVGIPIVAIIDTNTNPDNITYPIAGNDDAMRNIRLILEKLKMAVKEGNAHRKPVEQVVKEAKPVHEKHVSRTPAPTPAVVKEAKPVHEKHVSRTPAPTPTVVKEAKPVQDVSRTPAPTPAVVKEAETVTKKTDVKPDKKAEEKAVPEVKPEVKDEKKATKVVDKKVTDESKAEVKKKVEKNVSEKNDKKTAVKADSAVKKPKATTAKKKEEKEKTPSKETKKKADQPDK